VELKIQAKPDKRFFHRCKACGSEWPTSAEYCRRCGVWLGVTCNSEDILWYMPANHLPIRSKKCDLDGIYEAAVLTVAVCENIYVNGSECPELLLKVVKQIVTSGGQITAGPSGHLVGCFFSGDLVEAANRAVQCARTIQIESERYGVRTFMGINSGPIMVGNQMAQESGKSQKTISGGVIRCSEAIAFSLYPGMILLSPAVFKLVASHFECYGTGPMGLWGMYPNTPKTIYVVAGSKKVTSWRNRLDDATVPLVGRQEELGLLCQHWEETRSGKMPIGLIVHLVGEPGIGKSKLLQTFLAKVDKAGRDIILIKLAGANYGGRPGLLLEEFVDECLSKGILSTKTARKIPNMESETSINYIPKSIPTRVRLVSQLLNELKSRGPTLIVIDDVHWADRESIRVFGKAFSDLPGGIMVIISYRPSGLGLAKLLRKAFTRQITLGPLDESEAKQISKLHYREGEWITRSEWHEIWKKSQGNPLYVEEATKLLLTRRESSFRRFRSEITPNTLELPGTRAGLLSTRIREWADRELNELRQELMFRWGCSPRSRLASLENQVNEWLDRLETQGYLERTELAECLDELERFQDKVVEICLVGGLSRPLTTRLGEALSRLYEGSYKDHYHYLRQISRDDESRSWAGNQALRVAKRAVRAGKLREATRFYRVAEEMLPSDHPFQRHLLENAGDANLLLGRSSEAARLYEKALIENKITDPHNDIVHKLLAARILQGERLDLESRLSKDDLCPWHLILMSADVLLSKENGTALLFAEKAREVSSDWVTRSTAYLVEALVNVVVGNVENAAMLCGQAVETIESGGISLISLGLHWILSQVEGGPSRKRHMNTWKFIARQLGITSGLKAFLSKFDLLAANEGGHK
jgi:tetratricopeptide (TPR) repeat protein